MSDKDMLVSTTQAAEMLNVSIPTIRSWIEKGALKGFQKNPDISGSPYQIWLSSINEILEKRQRQSDTGPLGRLPIPTSKNATEN